MIYFIFVNPVAVLWGIYIFQAVPVYKCVNVHSPLEPYTCEPKDFCGKPDIKYEIDFDDVRSYRNWITDLELECKPKVEVGWQGTMFMIGYFISCFAIVPLMDFYGRKVIFLSAFCGYIIFLSGSLFV